MASISNSSNFGLYIPTTANFDPSEILNIKGIDPAMADLLIRLHQNFNSMALALNLKESAYYIEDEFLTGQQFFNDLPYQDNSAQYQYRLPYRIARNFGALPNNTSASVAHGLDLTNATATRIFGAATKSDKTSFLPIPYASPTLSNNISLEITNTDIVITTGSNRTDYNAIVVFEFLRD